MDADFAKLIITGAAEGFKGAIVWAFIMGIIFVIITGGLIWGSIYLYNHYSIIKTDKTKTSQISWPQQSTNVYSANLPH